jgi:hypothetical protein
MAVVRGEVQQDVMSLSPSGRWPIIVAIMLLLVQLPNPLLILLTFTFC